MCLATVNTKMVSKKKKKDLGLSDVISCRVIEAKEIETTWRSTVKLV